MIIKKSVPKTFSNNILTSGRLRLAALASICEASSMDSIGLNAFLVLNDKALFIYTQKPRKFLIQLEGQQIKKVQLKQHFSFHKQFCEWHSPLSDELTNCEGIRVQSYHHRIILTLKTVNSTNQDISISNSIEFVLHTSPRRATIMSVLTLLTGFLLCVLTVSSNVEMSLLSHRSGSGSFSGSTNRKSVKHELKC